MPDRTLTSVSVAANGTMTITNRVHLNTTLAATFSAVNTGATSPTVTVGAGNAYVDVVTVVVPNAPVAQAAVENCTYFGDKDSAQFRGIVQ
jgi:hypothetical protein